jgi:hypothetical protein
MRRVFVAKLAIFLYFHSVGVRFFVFGGVVVALFAVRACQGNLCPHYSTSLLSA